MNVSMTNRITYAERIAVLKFSHGDITNCKKEVNGGGYLRERSRVLTATGHCTQDLSEAPKKRDGRFARVEGYRSTPLIQ
jgi:hypothetical protein